MKLSRVILRVSDLDTATSFWSDIVGFDVLQAAGTFTFLDAGGVQLALNAVEQLPDPNLTELVLETESFADTHAAMVGRGVPFEVEPRPVMSADGQDLMATHFRDPDGNLASLTGWVASQA